MSTVARAVVSSVLRTAGSASAVVGGTGSASSVLPGSSVLRAAGSASTVLRAAGTASAVIRDAGTASAVIRDAGTASAVVRSSAVIRAAGTGSTVVRTAGTVSTVVRTAGTGSTLLRGSGTGSTLLGVLRDPMTGSSGRGISLARAPGCHRPFSTSSSSSSLREKIKAKWQKYKPGEDTMIVCGLLGAFSGICYVLDIGYKYVLKESQSTSKVYIDEKVKAVKKDLKQFQGMATGTHHDFVRKCNEATANMQAEVSDLRSRMLALEAREFKHRKELLLAAEILRKAELDAAKSAEQ